MESQKKLVKFRHTDGVVFVGLHSQYGPAIYDPDAQKEAEADEYLLFLPYNRGSKSKILDYNKLLVKKEHAECQFLICDHGRAKRTAWRYLEYHCKSLVFDSPTTSGKEKNLSENVPHGDGAQKAPNPESEKETPIQLSPPKAGDECWQCGGQGSKGLGKTKCTLCQGTGLIRPRPDAAYDQYGGKTSTVPGHIYKDDQDGNRKFV